MEGTGRHCRTYTDKEGWSILQIGIEAKERDNSGMGAVCSEQLCNAREVLVRSVKEGSVLEVCGPSRMRCAREVVDQQGVGHLASPTQLGTQWKLILNYFY